MARVVLLAGGSPHAHDYADIASAWERLLRSQRHEVVSTDHPDRLVELLGDGVDALVVNALHWRMEGEGYDRWRARWGYRTPPATRDAISRFVSEGGGLVANHTAPICFDDWAGWGEIVGCRWRWGVSSHPPFGPCRARIVGRHPIVEGSPPVLELDDEVYGDLWVAGDVDVLAVARRSSADADQPVLFTRRHGAGRVVFAGFGHHGASVEHPDHGPLLARAVSWVCDR
ncbi:MAG: ThuA domain-containing protein [Acidimicrobiia bacterium]|nr:ThuA domain-containing protein [Acidimicrobiia bacterium]